MERRTYLGLGWLLGTLVAACAHHAARQPAAFMAPIAVQPPPPTAQPQISEGEAKFYETMYTRVPFDLGCPVGQFTIQPIGGLSYGVLGCGRRISYSCICTYHVWTSCSQALCQPDGPAVATGTAAAPATPAQPAAPPQPVQYPATAQPVAH